MLCCILLRILSRYPNLPFVVHTAWALGLPAVVFGFEMIIATYSKDTTYRNKNVTISIVHRLFLLHRVSATVYCSILYLDTRRVLINNNIVVHVIIVL